jgi:hypothetical protein
VEYYDVAVADVAARPVARRRLVVALRGGGGAQKEVAQDRQCVYASLAVEEEVEDYPAVEVSNATIQGEAGENAPALPFRRRIIIRSVMVAQIAPELTVRIRIRRTMLYNA